MKQRSEPRSSQQGQRIQGSPRGHPGVTQGPTWFSQGAPPTEGRPPLGNVMHPWGAPPIGWGGRHEMRENVQLEATKALLSAGSGRCPLAPVDPPCAPPCQIIISSPAVQAHHKKPLFLCVLDGSRAGAMRFQAASHTHTHTHKQFPMHQKFPVFSRLEQSARFQISPDAPPWLVPSAHPKTVPLASPMFTHPHTHSSPRDAPLASPLASPLISLEPLPLLH